MSYFYGRKRGFEGRRLNYPILKEWESILFQENKLLEVTNVFLLAVQSHLAVFIKENNIFLFY